MIDVKENLTTVEAEPTAKEKRSFVSNQKVDADAAYQRLKATRKTLASYSRKINETNTVDIVGEHKALYEELEMTMKLIILAEQSLIDEGE